MIIPFDGGTLARLNERSCGTMADYLGIEFSAVTDDYLEATMPVDHRTKQPYGLLHGGASAVLAETVGSTAATLCTGEGCRCVGIEINANHLRGVTTGRVRGRARPLHVGRRTQVWEIRIEDDRGSLTCVSRLTLAVLEK